MSAGREPLRPDFARRDRGELGRCCEALWEIVADVSYFDPGGGVIDGHFELDEEQERELKTMVEEAYGEEAAERLYAR